MKDNPLVSIVTPSYNQGKFIEETIQSLLSQDYPNIEHIVMDGGSTDDTIEILKRYEGEIKWFSEKDRGQAHAVNKGWAMAKGEILGWVNSDDLLLPGAIREVVHYLNAHMNASIVYGKAHYIDEHGKVIAQYPTENFDTELLQEMCFICQPALFMRREVVDRVGMLNETLNYCMDYDYWVRASKIFKFDYIEKYFATQRLYGDAKTVRDRTKAFNELIETIKNHYDVVPLPILYGYERVRFPALRRLGLASTPLYLVMAAFRFIRMNHRLPLYGSNAWCRWYRKIFRRTKIGSIDL